jgi:hypothetical protein
MSRKVATLVYSKQVGSMARKAVLAYFADRANDDGSGIWTAKQRIADEIECSKQTVITTVKAMLADGLITESGRRPNGNGYTVEYAIDLAAVATLPDAKRDDEEVQILTGQELDGSTPLTPRGQPALPKPSLNRPSSSKATLSPKKRVRKSAPAFVLPDDIPADEWADFEEMRRRSGKPMTPKARTLAVTRLRKLADAGWPPGDVLNHSILNNYQGLFPPKDDHNGRSATNGMAGHRQPAGRTGDGFINAIRESRANREAVPWDADDPGRVPRLASLG